MAEDAAGEKEIIRPIFEPGDALLFDELFLHKTGSDPSMPNPRFAIENWFFNRAAVLAAKAVTLTSAWPPPGPSRYGSLLAGRLILPGHGFTAARGYPALSLADGSSLRATVASILYLALIALLQPRRRHCRAGFRGEYRGCPRSALPFPRHLRGHRRPPPAAPAPADRADERLDLAIQATTDLRGLPISPWAGLGVLAAWAAAALLAGGLLLRIRDA